MPFLSEHGVQEPKPSSNNLTTINFPIPSQSPPSTMLAFKEPATIASGPASGPDRSRVVALFTYPLKSAKGISHESIELLATGMEHDREWMVVKAATSERKLSQFSLSLSLSLFLSLTHTQNLQL